MTHVFISYVREDETLVQALCYGLREQGVTIWLDREQIKPGVRWRPAIREAIRNGVYFLACFSEGYAAKARTYMNEELTIAVEQIRQTAASRSWFIPVTFGSDCVPDRDIGAGETLRDIQWIDLGSQPNHQAWRLGLNRLCTALQITTNSPSVTHGLGLPAEIREPIIRRSEEALTSILRGTARQTIDAALKQFISDKYGKPYSRLLVPICEIFGNQFSLAQVVLMVTGGSTYGNSRTGFIGLCVLYEKHFEHMKSLKLREAFKENPKIDCFIRIREKYPPGMRLINIVLEGDEKDFDMNEFQFDPERFMEYYPNRGDSAFLDAVSWEDA